MSADTGWLIRQNQDGQFVLQMFFASAPEFPPIDAKGAEVFDSLEDAVWRYNEIAQVPDSISEYGLTLDIQKEK